MTPMKSPGPLCEGCDAHLISNFFYSMYGVFIKSTP